MKTNKDYYTIKISRKSYEKLKQIKVDTGLPINYVAGVAIDDYLEKNNLSIKRKE